jgi:hypothetical protein
MELLDVQGPKNNIKAVGAYLRADGPFKGTYNYFSPDLLPYRRYGLQLNAETIPV